VIKVVNARLRAFNIGYLDLYWDVAPCYEDLGNYEFTIQRAEAEFGPYTDITPAFRDQYHFRDSSIKGYHSFFNRIFYRIKVKNRQTGDEVLFPETGGVRLEGKPDLAALEMARLNNIRLREFSGRVIWVFPKKHYGQRCSVCFDRVTNRTIKSDCPSCYSTAFVGGYHTPIQTYGNMSSNTEATTKMPVVVENVDTYLLLGNYPELDEGDLVIDAENRRWRVGQGVNKVRKANALIRQQAQVHLIPRSDIEYKLPLNLTESEIKNLLAAPARNYTNPQTLSSANLDRALTNIFGDRL